MSNVMDSTGPWLVRVKENRMTVGLFACRVEELIDLLDEVCDAEECEFCAIPSGGVILADIKHPVDFDKDPLFTTEESMVTDGWVMALATNGHEWIDMKNITNMVIIE